MIPNHKRFIEAITDRRKTRLTFYSRADGGVLDLVCAPLDYGPGEEGSDGLNRYWFWDFRSAAGAPCVGLLPQQIVALHVLGENFDADVFRAGTWAWQVPRGTSVPPVADAGTVLGAAELTNLGRQSS